MKFLVIEDTEYKSKNIQRFLQGAYEGAVIEVARSFHGAKKALTAFQPDIVILDMSIQTSETAEGQLEGRNRMYGGRDVLAEMEFMGLQARVIVITQYDQFGEPPFAIDHATLFRDLKSKFPNLFVGGVFYNVVDAKWESEVKRLLKTITKN